MNKAPVAEPGAAQAARLAHWLAGYRPPGHDEMVDASGRVRAPYAQLAAALSGFDEAERERRSAAADQYLREAGVFYRVYAPGGQPGGEARAWPLSQPPLVIGAAEWAGLEAGLRQRASYLERLLADLYGERRVIAEGLLPALILGRNPEFLRPLADQGLSGEPLIRFIAVDLGRGADGRWWVLGDRTQAPSGAGFALENRVATGRALPEVLNAAHVRRLAPFFDRFRRSLSRLDDARVGKVGVLSPGPHNETYFEHAYLARYLGFQLLEGGDLSVAGDEVFSRTVEGDVPLGVLWRRLDAAFADPLELFAGSAIGVPGLCRAVRAGTVRLVNALGSGLLETRALHAYESGLAHRLIGQDLDLPSIATWWCGTHQGREPAADPCAVTLRPAFPGPGEQEEVDRALLRDDPAGLVAQESVRLSSVPAFVQGGLEPHAVSLRVFLARDEDGWHVMPGGFARLSQSSDSQTVSMQGGGRSCDVWVLGEAPEPRVSLLPNGGRFERRLPGALPARAADNLFWLGRQSERTEMTVRLARLAASRRGEADGTLEAAISDLVGPAGALRARLRSQAGIALDIAARIRDRFSPDGWRVLAEIVDLLESDAPDEEPLFSQLLTQLAGFNGLVRENMYQFTGWRFLQIGRQIERGLMTAHMGARMLAEGGGEAGVLEALLELADSRLTYRRRFSVDLHAPTVIDLCFLDPLNPRSLAFQVNEVERGLAELPGNRAGSAPPAEARRLARLAVRLRTADSLEVDAAFLRRVVADFAAISDGIGERYFSQGATAPSPSGGGE